MEFEIVGRKVDFGIKHILYTTAVSIATLILLFFLFGVLFSIASMQMPQVIADAVLEVTYFLDALITAAMVPIIAFLLLRAAPFFGFKQDVGFCRSAALGYIGSIVFIIYSDLSILEIFTYEGLFEIVGHILNTLFAVVIVYLWMLFFRSPDMEKIKKTAGFALVFSLLAVLVGSIDVFIHNYGLGLDWIPDTNELFWLMVPKFFWGFVLLYHLPEKIDRATLFVGGLFISQFLVGLIQHPEMLLNGNFHYLIVFLKKLVLALVLVGLGILMRREKKFR
jgi:hypothetical protein